MTKLSRPLSSPQPPPSPHTLPAPLPSPPPSSYACTSHPSILLWQVLLFLTDGKPNEPWGDEQYAEVKRQAAELGPNPTATTPSPAQALTLTLKP